jgi:two-component system, cell cycle sensor histidine kinase and response regulator CckA
MESAQTTHSPLAELELAQHELEQLQRLASIGAWSWDVEGDEVTVSAGFREIFGLGDERSSFAPEDIVGRLHPDDQIAARELARRFRPNRPGRVSRVRVRKPDGEVRELEARTEAVFDDERHPRVLRGVVQDVTERVRAEQQREAVHAVTRALADADDVDGAIGGVLAALAESTGWEAATLWQVDGDSGTLRCRRVWRGSSADLENFAAKTRQLEFRPGAGVPGQAWRKRRPVWRDVDPSDDPALYPRRDVASRAGLTGVLAFPLLSGDEVTGVIDLWRRPSGRPSPELIELLGSFGSQIGQFIERKRAEAALRESQELVARSAEAAIDCAITIDAGGYVLEFNPAAERTFGFSRAEVIGRELAELVVPARHRDAHRRGLARLKEGGRPRLLGHRVEMEAIRADGEEFPVELTLTQLNAHPTTYTGWIRDISERRRSERDLIESRELLAKTQRLAQIGSWEWETDSGRLIASDELYRLLGFVPRAESITLPALLAAVDPGHRDELRDALERCADKSRTLRYLRTPLAHPAGSIRVIEWFAEADQRIDGTRVVRGTAQNVTPEQELEAELATRARQQAAVARFGSEALVSSDFDSLIESAVGMVAGILDIDHTAVLELLPGGEELLLRAGRGWEEGLVGELTVSADRSSYSGYVLEVGKPVICEDLSEEDRFVPPAKLLDHGMISGIGVVIAGDGGPFGTLGAFAGERRRFSHDDVSFLQGMANVLAGAFAAERAAGLERQLQQAQRLDSVGKLAGGVAHDFNNLLSVILNHADFAIEEIPGNVARGEIEEIKRAAERAADLTRQLLLFSRKDIAGAEVIDPRAVVARMEMILGRTLGEHVRLETRLAPALPPVQIAERLLEQVLLNLVLNARDAMPEGGEIAIEATRVPQGRPPVPEQPGGSVRFSVVDSGTGMPPEVVDRAFEPFFTTKPEGEGTGLGLATAYGIIQRAQGRIEIESEPGRGTTVHVYIPAGGAAQLDHAEPDRSEDGFHGGSETVLLVEDEEPVRRLTRRILERSGYTVIDAEGPDAATKIWTEARDEIDLLLTDVVMPGRSGVRLWQELAEDRPSLEVIYMSGYERDVVSAGGALANHGTHLQKPFSSTELLHAVRSTLASHRWD